MKKLATLIAVASLSIAAPVFACPNMDHDAPKTVDKPKDSNETTAKAPAKKDAPKPADTAKAPAPAPSKDAPKEQPKKSGDKVSIR